MRKALYNYASTKDGRLEVTHCPDQRQLGHCKVEHRGFMNWRRAYWDLLRQRELDKGRYY